ncbi:MAG: aminopeptidase [Ruminococcaceae bacterium]|nr:aminopeptidase [Oscillospiraceae bacterium]
MTEKDLFEKLSYKRKDAYEQMSPEQVREMLDMCDEYRTFLDEGKTERECISLAEKMAIENSFRPLEEFDSLKPGDRVYCINRDKNILLAVIGEAGLEQGVNLVGAHVDSPRLDLKPNPLYEACDMALFKTHYYGGIKKYQWTAIPLALHGVVYTKSGEKIEICIGEKDTDPVFCVTDLLPHLAKDQMSKKMTEGIEGEALNILIGGIGAKAEGVSEPVKYKILSILNTLYGISEADFMRAELEAVPAFKARNVGLDESFVGAYGQDDRVCAFTTLKGILGMNETPHRTAVALLVDKEEIGSVGNTGMLSRFFEMALAEMLEKEIGSYSITAFNRMIRNSACLSSDVGAAVDPSYEGVNDKLNAAYAGKGILLMKYTGSRGKSGASDASAEFMQEIISILDAGQVVWQTGELGKVDQGGGGTIAMYVGNLNMDVIDCGVPVLSMHAPFEVTAKTDIYMAYRAYCAFYKLR